MLHIQSINIGVPQPIGGRGTPKFYASKTGIYKKPVEGPVFVSTEGLKNDFIADKKHHGGVDQAVYIYTCDDYVYWDQLLGQHCPPGMFGENLTIEGIRSADAHVGDRYIFEDVTLEVTSPRIPCSTLSARMNDNKFVKAFTLAKRPGLYCRVIKEGCLKSGDVAKIAPYEGTQITVGELFANFPFKKLTEEARTRYASAPQHWKLLAFLRGERDTP